MFLLNELPENDCRLGVLAMGNIAQTGDAGGLSAQKRDIEAKIRDNFGNISRAKMKTLHPMDVYVPYYRQFGYTYHVLLQMESIVKGKTIPNVLPLVEAMFMAELKNMLLTAGHDLDRIKLPLRLEKAGEGCGSYTALAGGEAASVTGDVILRDEDSIISSILRGPDKRTAISLNTTRAVFTVYAPKGVEEQEILRHLKDIEAYVRLFSPYAESELCHIY